MYRLYRRLATAAIILRSLNSNAFVNSGVMIRDPEADAFLTNNLGGKTFAPRYLGPLADNEPNISSDDPSESPHQKVTAGKIRLSGKASTSRGLRWI